MTNKKQATGGSVKKSFGNDAGVNKITLHKVSVPNKGGLNTSPNSSKRKQG